MLKWNGSNTVPYGDASLFSSQYVQMRSAMAYALGCVPGGAPSIMPAGYALIWSRNLSMDMAWAILVLVLLKCLMANEAMIFVSNGVSQQMQ